MKDPPIFFYDEATSSLDSSTEQHILKALVRPGITRAPATHRAPPQPPLPPLQVQIYRAPALPRACVHHEKQGARARVAQNGARLQRWARRLCTRFGLILFQQKGVTENRTSIMIAHRLSTIIDADKILVSAQTWPRERWTMGVRAPHRQLRCTACHPQALSVFLPAPVPGAPGRADRRTGDSRGTPRRQRALLESVEEPDRCQLHGVNRHMWVWCVCVCVYARVCFCFCFCLLDVK